MQQKENNKKKTVEFLSFMFLLCQKIIISAIQHVWIANNPHRKISQRGTMCYLAMLSVLNKAQIPILQGWDRLFLFWIQGSMKPNIYFLNINDNHRKLLVQDTGLPAPPALAVLFHKEQANFIVNKKESISRAPRQEPAAWSQCFLWKEAHAATQRTPLLTGRGWLDTWHLETSAIQRR